MSPAGGARRGRILLEVAVSTVDDARTAHAEGADRLELNAALELGGLTPSMGTLLAVKEATPLPVVVMVRPRAGGFVYSEAEFATMLRDVELAVRHGADGVATGVLNGDRTIDRIRTRALLERLDGRVEGVFHRAFDLTPDPLAALETLIELGVKRVLTSGQQSGALEGGQLIGRLIERAAGRIEVLPGSGVTAGNVAAVVAMTGADQVHGSFSEEASDYAGPVCPARYRVTSALRLRETRAVLARL